MHGFMCTASSALNILAATNFDQLDSIQLRKRAVECEVKISAAEHLCLECAVKTFQSNLLAKVNRRKSESREISAASSCQLSCNNTTTHDILQAVLCCGMEDSV